MAQQIRVKTVSPMLAVADMEKTIAFYEEVLGFKPVMRSAAYGIVERDGQTIHFQQAESAEVLSAVRGHAEIYIEVRGIHSLWERVQAFKNRFRTRDLFEQGYGMTEFHIEDPNGCLIFVGEPTAQ
jgi:catechol 2,3-dioxygenase-like lactoylglutathione lyase family enzyme